jgi:D-ribose pyranase
MASETDVHNPAQAERIRSYFADVELVSHEELKTTAAHFVVRTGDATPYSNVLLRAGVAFD